jgi:8-oxo-dGTP pyrophosphatase MutT (NUDIX family)
MGRAKECPTLSKQTREATLSAMEASPSQYIKKKFVGLAVVGMVSWGGKLLITRRPPYMRSFPRSYVFPGGGVDPGESLVQAVAREIKEETGLVVDRWKLECIWESVFPTVAKPGVPIKAHHLVCYFSGQLDESFHESQQALRLCEEEVDGALWLSREDIKSILVTTSDSILNGKFAMADDRMVQLYTNDKEDESFVRLSDCMGVYPRENETGEYCGMAQGSLFALEKLVSEFESII